MIRKFIPFTEHDRPALKIIWMHGLVMYETRLAFIRMSSCVAINSSNDFFNLFALTSSRYSSKSNSPVLLSMIAPEFRSYIDSINIVLISAILLNLLCVYWLDTLSICVKSSRLLSKAGNENNYFFVIDF